MNKKDQVTNEIKQDILEHLDEIAKKIYDIISVDPQATSNVENVAEAIFMIVKEIDVAQQEKEALDRFLGKQECPPPIEHDDGSVELYSEIDVCEICNKIKIANNIFVSDYKFTFKKGQGFDDLPESIKQIIEAYKLSDTYENKKDYRKSDQARKWLINVSLVGAIRFLGKANTPYLLDREIESIAKRFMKNLECLISVISGEKYMSDPENNGLALFDVENSYSSKKIRFVKRKK